MAEPIRVVLLRYVQTRASVLRPRSVESLVNDLLPFAEFLSRLPLPANRRFKESRARLDRIIYRIIEERRASGEDRGDLLSMLLKAQDEEGDGTGMSDEQLRDEAMTIFLAGHETTANALAWTWYLLSQNPEAEARLHAELEEALSGRPPTAEDLPRLRYNHPEPYTPEEFRRTYEFMVSWGLIDPQSTYDRLVDARVAV